MFSSILFFLYNYFYNNNNNTYEYNDYINIFIASVSWNVEQ